MTGYVRNSAYRRKRIVRKYRSKRARARVYPSRRRRTRRRTGGSKITRLAKRVNKIATMQKSTTATMTFRTQQGSMLAALQAFSEDQFYHMNTHSLLEVAIDKVPYFDPTDPTQRIITNFGNGAYSKAVRFVKSYMKITVRANYLVPVRYTMYLCNLKSKGDTSFSPSSLFATGIIDQTEVGNPNTSLLYPTDFQLVKDVWHMKVVKRGLLQAGAEFTCRHSVGSFDYDPSVHNVENLVYQKMNKAFGYMLRIHGCLMHDEDGGPLVGEGPANVDVLVSRTWKIQYDGGFKSDYYLHSGSGGAVFLGGGIVTNRAKAQNQITLVGKGS